MSTSTIGHVGVPAAVAKDSRSSVRALWTRLGANPGRFFKITGGSAVLFAAVYAVTSQQQYVSSNNAVVSAQVVSLKVPIEGYVSGFQVNVSEKAEKGQLLGHITNSRVDNSNVLGYDEKKTDAVANSHAASIVRTELLRERQQLENRAKEHDAIAARRITDLLDQSQKLYDAKIAVQEETVRKLKRAEQLFSEGIISRNNLEVYQSQNEVAIREAEAQLSALTAIQAEAEAARKGLSAQMTENDVAYSRQRIDEINLRLADLDRALSIYTAQATSSAELEESAKERIDLLRSTDLVAPISGTIWKLGTSEGERVGVGDMIAEFVDCNRSFLLVSIPQDRVPDIAIGSTAQFRLSGEAQNRTGKVTSIDGDGELTDHRKMAVLPGASNGKTGSALVRISLSSGTSNVNGNECIVGRTARVLLPTNSSSFLSRNFRSLR